MTPQEQSMLGDLVRRVQQTQLPEKDPEAAQLLDQQLGRNPDSLYVLAQTVLVQKYALEQAQKQLEQLKQQASAQPAKPTSFLGSIFGHKDQEPAPPQQQYAQQPPYTPVNQPPAYPQQAAYPPPQYGGPQYGAPQAYPAPGGGGSSFLRSAGTTAAGVAAGALAFEGVESLMHGFGHEAGFGGGGGFGGFGGGGGFGNQRPEETVVNNYYDEPRGGDRDSGFDASDRNDRDDRNDDRNIDDASYNTASDDNLQPQVDQADDVNVTDDDSGSFDDASLGDDSGGDDSSFV